METPKVLKFKNGDLVIATIRDSDTNELFWMDNPIAVVPYPVIQEDVVGETFLLKPWIGITTEKTFLIPKSEIITVCLLRENLLVQYERYITGEVKLPEETQETNVDMEMLHSRLLRSRNLLN
jgi:hypothetical protein